METLHETRPLLDYMPPRGIAKELWQAIRFYREEKKISSALACAIPLCLLVYAIATFIASDGRFSSGAAYTASIFGLIMAGLFASITSSAAKMSVPVTRFRERIKLLPTVALSASALFLWIWASASIQLIANGQASYVMSKPLFFGYITLLVTKAIIACVAYPRPEPPKEQAAPKNNSN